MKKLLLLLVLLSLSACRIDPPLHLRKIVEVEVELEAQVDVDVMWQIDWEMEWEYNWNVDAYGPVGYEMPEGMRLHTYTHDANGDIASHDVHNFAGTRPMWKRQRTEMTPAALANLALAVESEELSIPAGLQDRVAQAFNHPVFMDFDREFMKKHGFGQYELIDIPKELNIYIAYRTDLAEGSEILPRAPAPAGVSSRGTSH